MCWDFRGSCWAIPSMSQIDFARGVGRNHRTGRRLSVCGGGGGGGAIQHREREIDGGEDGGANEQKVNFRKFANERSP